MVVPFIRVAVLVAVFAVPLWAQNTSIPLGPDASVVIPSTWKVLERRELPPSASQESGAPHVIFRAAPADDTGRVICSIYRLDFRNVGPAIWSGATAAVDGEVEKTLNAVISQGFTPVSSESGRVANAKGTPMLTIRVTAKDSNNQERIFLTTVVAFPGAGSPLRLSVSYPSKDQKVAQEVIALLDSLVVGPKTAFMGPGSGNSGISPGNATAPGTSGPSATGGTATQAPKGISGDAAQMVQNYNNSLIIVQGQKGVGSGFLCNVEGQTYVYTNAHVLADNTGIKLVTLGGTALTPTSSAIAAGIDAVRMAVAPGPKAFELMSNLDATVKIGDAVAVLGNSEGAGVVKPCEGKVVGIGPNLVEVDAPFVPGNSGSPIIHVASGKVLGIATYLTERRIGTTANGAVVVQTRRFGYRLDSVARWEPINWTNFYSQAAQVAKIEALSQEFIAMGEAARSDRKVDPSQIKNPALKRAMENLQANTKRFNQMSEVDRNEVLKRFFGDLRSISRLDIASFNSAGAYDYFRRKVDEQGKFRDELYKAFTQMMDQQSTNKLLTKPETGKRL